MPSDIYEISGRVKNIIAREDIALSPIGKILVNYYTLMLKSLYDFSETLPLENRIKLDSLIKENEILPMLVIKVSSQDQGEYKSLYDQVMETRNSPQFGSNEEALSYYELVYKALTECNGYTGDGFWLEAESESYLTEDHKKIMKLARAIKMCKYLISKENG